MEDYTHTTCGHVLLDEEGVTTVHTVISEDASGWVVSNKDLCADCAEDVVDGVTCFDDWDTMEKTLRGD